MTTGNDAFPALPPRAGAKTLDELQLSMWDYARRIIDYLKLLPAVEYKTIGTTGVFPIYVSTRINTPIEVRRCQTYEKRDTGQAISDTDIAWRVSSDPRRPGVFITDISGLTAGVDYTVVIAIQGGR